MKSFIHLLVSFGLIIALSACGQNIRHAIGVTKKAPDAFKVVSNPPLSMPPDFSLIHPNPSAQGPEHTNISSLAEQTVFQQTSDATSSHDHSPTTTAERTFLQVANADKALPNIRKLLDEELAAAEQQEKEKGFLRKILDVARPEQEDPLIAAQKEKKRIEANEAEGKPITAGEPATNEGKQSGLLNRIFGL